MPPRLLSVLFQVENGLNEWLRPQEVLLPPRSLPCAQEPGEVTASARAHSRCCPGTYRHSGQHRKERNSCYLASRHRRFAVLAVLMFKLGCTVLFLGLKTTCSLLLLAVSVLVVPVLMNSNCLCECQPALRAFQVEDSFDEYLSPQEVVLPPRQEPGKVAASARAHSY